MKGGKGEGSAAGLRAAPALVAANAVAILGLLLYIFAGSYVNTRAIQPTIIGQTLNQGRPASTEAAGLPSYPNADLSPELHGVLAKVAINHTVAMAIASNISISNDPKTGLLDLFVESAQRANVSNLFVAAYDQVTLDWLVARGVPAVLRQMPTNCAKAAHWAMCAKADLARDVVALGYNALLLDTDVLFFRNPLEGGLDGSFDVQSSSDAMDDELQCGPFGAERVNTREGFLPLYTYCVGQLNLGVVWFTASRRLADTLSYMAETVRTGSFIWDQALFTRLLLLPNSRKFPWSGRHSLRMMDPLVFPNTCNLKMWLTLKDIANMQPVLLHFNCSPPAQRRDIMLAVWRAYKEGRPYLLEARECPPKAVSCRPEHLAAMAPAS